ncbi:MAG: serine hydrolase [Candidatus Cyclobacteriaceae bacterium M2_1C_046]
MKIIFIALAILFSTLKTAFPQQHMDKNILEQLLRSNEESFGTILNDLSKYEVQILYTQIDRDKNNKPSFKLYSFNVDPKRYFYPASTVKMPVAFLSLEKLNNLDVKDLDKYSSMLTDSAFSGQSTANKDITSETGLPSIAHYIKKLFVVSDNDAFNRLYEFLGPQYINEQLHKKGYERLKIRHRLSIPLTQEENLYTNPIRFLKGDTVTYKQPLLKSSLSFPSERILKGIAYIREGVLMEEPMDFGSKNFLSVEDMQMMLRAVIFPEAVDEKRSFNLSEEDYRFLYKYMSQLPRETLFPAYDSVEFYDAYVKFLIYGNDSIPIPGHIRIFNKIGLAYGYMTDNAYIIDLKNNVEFFLTAVIHVNENQTYNDGIYEYKEIGFPFMKNLGQLIYDYELNRKRKYTPDLSRFDNR